LNLRLFARDFFSFARWRAAATIGLVVVGAVAESVGILLLVPLFSIITSDAAQGSPPSAAETILDWLPGLQPNQILPILLGSFVAALAVRSVVIFYRDLALARLQANFVVHHRMTVLRGLASADWERIVHLSHGRISHILSNDVDRLGSAVITFLQIVVGLILVTTQAALAFALAPLLAMFTLMLLSLPSVIVFAMSRRAGRAGQQLTTTQLKMMSNTQVYLGSLKQAMSENRQDGFVDKAERTLGKLAETYTQIARDQSLAKVGTAMAGGVIAAAAVWVGHTILAVPAPALIAFLLLLARLSVPMIQVQQSSMQLATLLPAYGAIRALQSELDERLPPRLHVQEQADEVLCFDIVFENVSYFHKDSAHQAAPRRGICDLNALLEQGEFVGVRGHSGSGKTTFADLICGLLVPQRGQIRIGGRQIEPGQDSSWRRSLAYVSQDSFLFHGSIRDNLCWDSETAQDSDIWQALAASGAKELVLGLPDRLENLVGERGLMLSGGERQRLAIARAILRRPRLLILDEATNALDAASERRVWKALRNCLPSTTIVLISHSDHASKACDRILEFDRGRLLFDLRQDEPAPQAAVDAPKEDESSLSGCTSTIA
jgi:ATP-binding cassette subfamily C protein